MKKSVRLILIVLFVGVFCFLAACSSSPSSSSSSSKEEKVVSSAGAINTVKAYGWTNQAIALELNFYNFYNPKYGNCSAILGTDDDGNEAWCVTLHGNMSGYKSSSSNELETKEFVLTAYAYKDGSVGDVKVTRK